MMRKNLAVLLAGVLIGGLLFLAYPTTAATTSKRLKRLENKVETLQKKTRFLTRQGDYRSFIIGSQVLSLCLDGDSATWTNPINEVTEIDTCETSPKSTQPFRDRLGQR
jgi:hypothetical protein